MPELPTGTVTFLFTDLEGSTRLWEEHPDAMQPALARHDEILRDAISAHDGSIVKMTGDGAHAAFASATLAVSAARDAQVALAGEAWDGIGRLRVRMGIHTGPAEARDGDYFGTAVNRAARLMSAANGGQVVVSLATEELLRDDMPDGCSLLDLGEHSLRDLARSERVFQLCAEGLESDFAPVRSLDAYSGNLPTQLTSFVGRDDDLGTIAAALRDARIVTLTGVGGVGKTRLAMQVAAEMLPEFPDGAWLCELAAASDPEAMVQVVAATLGVQPRAGASLEDSIVEFLRTKRLLLVLDNCEHLLNAAAELTENALRHCSGLRVLATSREGLAVAGEQVRPLRSLTTSHAELLFAERARAAAPDFTIDSVNAPAVAEVCRRLDGIPLAIELAAARVVAMSAEEIAGLLDERFRLLTGGRRTAVERHQTLQAMVDWSYSLLDPTERLVFDRLGVFSGSFDAASASAVVAGEGVEAWDARDALAGLVGRSMLVAERGDDGTTRYSMLETLRQYARERLEEGGEADAWRRRHAAHYAAFAAEAGAALLGPDELAARRRIHQELDNLRAALTWALDRDDPDDVELGVAVVAELATESTMNVASGIGMWAELALPHTSRSTPGRRFAVGAAAAWTVVACRADPERAAALARETIREGIPVGGIPADARAASLAYNSLAMALQYANDFDGMFAALEDGVRWLDAIGEHGFHWATLHSSWSVLAVTGGDLDLARAEGDKALAVARELRNPSCLALALFSVAWAEWDADPERALAAVEESIALTRAGAVDGAFGSALVVQARVRTQLGDQTGGLEALREAIAYSHGVGDRANLSYALFYAVQVLTMLGESAVAGELAGAVQQGELRAMTVTFIGSEGTRRDEALAQLQSVLGPAAFDAAIAHGASLSYDDVVALALTTIDALLAGVEVADA